MTDFRPKIRIGVLYGGRSGEHEVSLRSARSVMTALDPDRYEVVPIGITKEGRWVAADVDTLTSGAVAGGMRSATLLPEPTDASLMAVDPAAGDPAVSSLSVMTELDVVFPVLHGPYGEDGTVQGLLEMASVPYVGSGVLASAVAMDKAIARQLFAQHGLPQVRYMTVMRRRWQAARDVVVDEIEAELSYPLFIKPANMGSSVGVSKARNREQLVAALDVAAHFDRKLLVEEAVPHAREIEVSVLGNEAPVASIAGEIIPANEFYDYNAKYENEGSRLLIPAPIDDESMASVRDYAVRAFQALDCAGLARVDFLVDGESGAIYLNEINTMPGFTRISMYPKLWEATGIPYPELVNRLLALAMEAFAERQANSTART